MRTAARATQGQPAQPPGSKAAQEPAAAVVGCKPACSAAKLPCPFLAPCLLPGCNGRCLAGAALPAGYAFLEFRTHEAADMLLKSYNGQPIPGTDQVFRLNWAAYGVGKAQPPGEGAAGRLQPAAAAGLPLRYSSSLWCSLWCSSLLVVRHAVSAG